MTGEHDVALLCDVLAVSRSGYYRWLKVKPSARLRRDTELARQIRQLHRQSRGSYGAPRILEDLKAAGVHTSEKRCARLMKQEGLRGRKKHRRRPRTTDSRHGQPTAANVLALVEAPTAPNQVWVTDITYLDTAEGWLYVAAILDLFSRRIVGWACGPTLAATLVLAAWRDARRRRQPSPGLLHHSDRGSQYVDGHYLRELERDGIARSMSRTGNCYDNATMESFWSTLKTETALDATLPATRRDAELAVFDYIETFYNPTRRHSSLGYLSPVAYENQYRLKNTKAA
jgi:transposase InsO family protein